MSLFNLEVQNENLDNKIVVGLEKLSQVFRVLLWDKAKELSLSPIQIQILIFIKYHSAEKSTISYLAQEFNVTKPTISDAVKVLEQKKLVKKNVDSIDTRSYSLELSLQGKKIVTNTEFYIIPLSKIISKTKAKDKEILWQTILNLIKQLNELEIIGVQRTCFNCSHFVKNDKFNYCMLLNQKLLTKDIRIDCFEFQAN